MSKLAIVTGALGQDGYYLSRELIHRGIRVLGTTHRILSTKTTEPFELRRLDVTDRSAISSLVADLQPYAIFNLAARASSSQLFDDPDATTEVNARSVLWWLEAIRKHSPGTRFCQASSCEVFAGCDSSPQTERTAYAPTSAYGAAKAFADHLVRAYRTTFGIFAGSAILYPHESPRRDPHFIVKKVVKAAVEFATKGRQEPLTLGSLSATRDWSYAGDVVRGLCSMLEHDTPHDFVFGSGTSTSVEELCRLSFEEVGLSWESHVRSTDAFVRPIYGAAAIADSTKARRELGWETSLSFAELVHLLVEAELRGSA